MSTTARALGRRVAAAAGALAIGVANLGLASGAVIEIGRASCRERV